MWIQKGWVGFKSPEKMINDLQQRGNHMSRMVPQRCFFSLCSGFLLMI